MCSAANPDSVTPPHVYFPRPLSTLPHLTNFSVAFKNTIFLLLLPKSTTAIVNEFVSAAFFIYGAASYVVPHLSRIGAGRKV